MDELYEPREDSELLAKEVKKYAFGKVLDMGTGSGIQAEAAKASINTKSVLAADINPKAVEFVKKKGIKAVKSNLFSNIKDKFDTIIFNLPYLPDEHKAPDIALDGGEKGYELTVKFLSQVGDHLNEAGIILMLFSTLTDVKVVDEAINQYCFKSKNIASQKVSFEEMIVYKLEWIDELKPLLKNITSIQRLAKGHRGLIFTGMWNKKKVTVKVQRQDIAARGTVNNEILQLKKLSKHGIGPEIVMFGNDYFVYNYIEGEFVIPYLEKASKANVVKVLKDVFDQMRTMDKMGLNKEEMHHPHKHILIGDKVVLVDFERCKPSEKLHNVTQFCQFMMSGHIKPVFDRIKIKIDRDKMMGAAKTYSDSMTDKDYKAILSLLK